LGSKTTIYLYPGPVKHVQVPKEAFSSLKRPSSTSKFLNFFLLLWVLFALQDPDPDPLIRLNPYPIGIRIRNPDLGRTPVAIHVSPQVQVACIVGLVAAMSVQGLANLSAQRAIVGEYSDVQLEEMLEWINANVPPTGVFAGIYVPPVLRIRDVYPGSRIFFNDKR
jgi:hypothetical protein